MNRIFTWVFLLIFGLGVATAAASSVDVMPVKSNSYTLIVSIPFQDDIDIRVSPNPANDYFAVTSNINYSKIQLFNIIGKPLKTYRVSADNNYQLTDVPGGIYILRFMDSNNQVIKTIKLYKKN